MKKITLLTLCACCIFTAFSEHVPKAYKKYFVNCCNTGKTNIRHKINIDGYFTFRYSVGTIVSTRNILFFDNGLCVSNWSISVSTSDEELREVSRNGSKSDFYRDAPWGTYEIKGDTIITRTIVRASLLRPDADFRECIYKVKNSTTLINLSYSPGVTYESSELNFVPCQDLPNPDYSWIKKQKCKPCDRLGSPIQTRHK